MGRIPLRSKLRACCCWVLSSAARFSDRGRTYAMVREVSRMITQDKPVSERGFEDASKLA